MTVLEVECPRKLAPLLRPKRYKGAHGGRGGGKSYFFAMQVVLACYSKKTRVVCIREVQKSLKESVRQLIVDTIYKLKLGAHFEILEGEIRGPRGSLIIFVGMQAYNAENIKSLEGFDIAWVEEAQTLSEVSLRMLRPTIRKAGSEIWFSWNPRHKTDAIDQFLRGSHPPEDAEVIEINWCDNPWFPEELRKEMMRDYVADEEMAAHVWGGGYQMVTEGSYYARLLVEAEKQGRIGDFPYNPNLPLRTAWDLGIRDYTSIWFVQDDGIQATVVDFYEVSGDGADDIIAAAMPEVFVPPPNVERWHDWSRADAQARLQRPQPFKYTEHYMPHDIRMREWMSGERSRIQAVQEMGLANVRRGAAAHPSDRVQACRALLPLVRFNDTPRVRMGIERLRMYRRKWSDILETYTEPLHDENSHAADAFGEYAVNCPIHVPIAQTKPDPIKQLLKPKTLNDILEEEDLADVD